MFLNLIMFSRVTTTNKNVFYQLIHVGHDQLIKDLLISALPDRFIFPGIEC